MSRFRQSLKRYLRKLVPASSTPSATRGFAPKHFYPELPRLRTWTQQDIIFDVGANDGRSVPAIREFAPVSQIHSFEPVFSTFQELVASTRGDANARQHQLALGAEPGEAAIFINELAAMNSFRPDFAKSKGTETVTLSTVDHEMERLGIDFLHFLKIDTEGHDLEVLKGARRALSDNRIAIIQAEVRFDIPGLGIRAFMDFFEPHDYTFYGLFNQCRSGISAPEAWSAGESAGYKPSALNYADAVFVCGR